jgi:hypothetical protein
VGDAARALPFDTEDPLGQSTVTAQWVTGRLALIAGSAKVHADAPEKAREPGPTMGRPGAAMHGVLDAMASGQREVGIMSPYFAASARVQAGSRPNIPIPAAALAIAVAALLDGIPESIVIGLTNICLAMPICALAVHTFVGRAHAKFMRVRHAGQVALDVACADAVEHRAGQHVEVPRLRVQRGWRAHRQLRHLAHQRLRHRLVQVAPDAASLRRPRTTSSKFTLIFLVAVGLGVTQ